MKRLITNNNGFTVAELLISLAIGSIIIATILSLTMVTQRLAEGVLNQISLTTSMKNPIEMISRDIRNAVRIDYYETYTKVTPVKNADYIQVFFPAGHGLNNVGYYVLNEELRKITNLATDDNSITTDDKLIATGIKSNNVFRDFAPLVMRLKFDLRNKSNKETGKKTGKVDTYINLRN